MTLVPSLLQAIVLMDGEALVLHVGDKPVRHCRERPGHSGEHPADRRRQSVRSSTNCCPSNPGECSRTSAPTQCVLPENPLFPGERFSVVAARGGDDLWLEIRRQAARHLVHTKDVIEMPPAAELPHQTARTIRRNAAVPPAVASTHHRTCVARFRVAPCRGAAAHAQPCEGGRPATARRMRPYRASTASCALPPHAARQRCYLVSGWAALDPDRRGGADAGRLGGARSRTRSRRCCSR